MIQIRRGEDRGHFAHGWLDTYHTFSFGEYFDPRFHNFRSLRVINEDRVQPGQGFGRHGHRDMEIITYVLSGSLEHRDSLGSGSILRAGQLQRMTAGSGIEHSEFNPSDSEPVHLYQIWIIPDKKGLTPEYEERPALEHAPPGEWRLVAGQGGPQGAMAIHQDCTLSLATLNPAQEVRYDLSAGRHAWLQVVRGEVSLGQHKLVAGDGAALSEEPAVVLTSITPAEVMLFDLA